MKTGSIDELEKLMQSHENFPEEYKDTILEKRKKLLITATDSILYAYLK